MKLCGQISVELTVGDYVEAAEHQRRLQEILRQVRDAYPEAHTSPSIGFRCAATP